MHNDDTPESFSTETACPVDAEPPVAEPPAAQGEKSLVTAEQLWVLFPLPQNWSVH